MDELTNDLLDSLKPNDFLCPPKELQDALLSYANHVLSEETSAPTLKENNNIEDVTNAWVNLEADRNFIEVAVSILSRIQAAKKIPPIQCKNEEEDDEEESTDADGDDEEIDLRDYDDEDEQSSQIPKKDVAKKATPFQESLEKEKKKISKLEKELVEPKDWQLLGEATAEHRPVNSLLEEHLQFDFVSREPPLITEVTTKSIEERIRDRIKENNFDDVVRKVKPTEEPFEFRRRLGLEHEKSKASLAQVYEQEYLKKVQSQEGMDVSEKNPLHEEISKMAKVLFHKLASLSSFHYTPPVHEPELKIINNLPAVSVEEAIPEAVSDAALLAPEEIVSKKRREGKEAGEKTDTDRKRDRRAKKKHQKVIAAHKAAKSETGAPSAKYSKLNKARELEGKKPIKSSKSFFQMLDDQVKSDLNANKEKLGRKKQTTGPGDQVSGTKFKL